MISLLCCDETVCVCVGDNNQKVHFMSAQYCVHPPVHVGVMQSGWSWME